MDDDCYPSSAMDETAIRIGFATKGYAVECLDPDIQAANNKPSGSYRSPWVEYQFDTADQVCEFVDAAMKIVKSRKPKESTAFDAAFAEATKEDAA